jgi:replication factor A1
MIQKNLWRNMILKSKANQSHTIFLKRFPMERSRGQGRFTGQRESFTELTNCWYLMWISKKYGLETHKFLACFLDAWIHEKSSCEDMSIQCRQKTVNGGVFLVTQGQKVVAQLSLSEMALKRLPDIDLASFPWNESTLIRKTEKLGPIDTQIKDVNAGVKWINLKARVVEKSITRRVYSRLGSPYDLSTAVISDNTGFIKLPLWNAQVNMVSIGDTIQIENGRVERFRGELQVSVGKNGKLEVI